MKALSLYEMSDKYSFLLNDLYDEETGVVNETTLAKLNALEDSIENKCINITKLFQAIEATKDLIKAEKERLQKREQSFTNQVNSLKEYLRSNMDRCQIKKIECPEFSISLQNNPIAIEVLNMDDVPSDYDKCQKRELDTNKIKEDIKKGVDIPGVRLVQRNHIRIR
jgi:Siphovirus Gp157